MKKDYKDYKKDEFILEIAKLIEFVIISFALAMVAVFLFGGSK